MRLAVAGKGGAGKTTVLGTVAREMARRGRRVVAIDADPNPTLATTIGVALARAESAPALPADLLEPVDDGGSRSYRLRLPVAEVVAGLGVRGPDGIVLLTAGRVEHAARGCMCGTHAAVRAVLGAVDGDLADVVAVDMEAGVEHLSRAGGTLVHADALLVVLEPFHKALLTGRRIAVLAAELGIPHRYAVGNKVRSRDDAAAVDELCSDAGLTLLGSVPWDARLQDAESAGVAPVDLDPAAPGVAACRRLALDLLDRFDRFGSTG